MKKGQHTKRKNRVRQGIQLFSWTSVQRLAMKDSDTSGQVMPKPVRLQPILGQHAGDPSMVGAKFSRQLARASVGRAILWFAGP
jgi:hypothetical protein